MAALGLRGKSLILLLLGCALTFVLAGVIGWNALEGVQQRYADSYARNVVQLNRERLFGPITRELALAQRLAESQLTRRWLLDESDPQKKSLFFREAEGYQGALNDHAYFVASAISGNYYFNGSGEQPSEAPRFTMRPDRDTDAWFYRTMEDGRPYEINVDYNTTSRDVKVFFNVLVRDDERILGVVGSAITLTDFLKQFVNLDLAGVESMVLDRYGSIIAHPRSELVTYNAEGASGRSLATHILGQVTGKGDAEAVREALQRVADNPQDVETLAVHIEGSPRLLALGWIPELNWYVAASIDLQVAQVIEARPLLPALGSLLLLLLALIGGTLWLVEKRVLGPLRQLRRSAQAIAAGRYDTPLPGGRDDEIGELSAAFGAMASKVRSYTGELEKRVAERTHELEEANREMALAHKKIDDSIDYASLIQRAILPDRHMVNHLGEHHCVLWRPRDVVGGDFYVFRGAEQACLFGVVDCAGHGVPGALMTMLGRAVIDQAISDCGLSDPAGILARADRILRGMLLDEDERRMVATNMDVGLAYVDLEMRQVTFAGAKIALYYSDGNSIEQLPGARRAIGDKRVGEYFNQQVELAPERSFYMSTDGFLDQAGGDQGFGFGNTRFAQMLLEHARRPMHEQGEVFSATLAEYQGSYPQRDDITMLCFRFG